MSNSSLPSPPFCSAFDPANPPTYGYTPSLAAGILFSTLFLLLTLTHSAQLLLSRRYWLLVFILGCIGETLGWAARTWAHYCPYADIAFEMQISTLIFSPAFFAAGIYIVLGYIIRIFGPGTSMLSPKQYLWVFCSVDFVTLLLQAIGGGIASAADDDQPDELETGTNIMIVGIVFQLASNVVFAGFFARALVSTYRPGKGLLNLEDLALRSRSGRVPATTTKRLRILCAATTVSTLCLIARGVYRSIELIQGWRGYLILTQRYFIGLDGSLMVIAVAVFAVANPHWLLPHKDECPENTVEEGETNKAGVFEKCLGKKRGSESS
ncbi:MAG: hypothetical protein Q9190_002787 [Brigantiaea leucoxantha]